jgi:hypothetical protein
MSLPGRYMRACVEQVHRRYNEWITAAGITRLQAHDTVVYSDTTLGAQTLSLPPVSEVTGIQYYIKHWLGGATITITAYKSDSVMPTITALALGDAVLVESDGLKWHLIA